MIRRGFQAFVMKTPRNKITVPFLAPGLLIWCSITSTSPAQVPRRPLSITIEIAADKEAPLLIVGIKRPQRSGAPPYLHVTNTSSLKTRRFWVEAFVISANGGVYRTNHNAPNELWPAERIIPSAADRWVRETVLQTSSLAIAAKELHSTCLRVIPLIIRVDFVDGTSWRSNLEDGSLTLRSRLTARENACPGQERASNPPEPIPDVAIENNFRGDSLEPSEGEKSYAYLCPVVVKGKKSVALCPF
jgi:hypothetical protein